MQILRRDSHLWLLLRASIPSSGDGSVIFPWSTSPSLLFMVREVWVKRDYGGKGSSCSMGGTLGLSKKCSLSFLKQALLLLLLLLFSMQTIFKSVLNLLQCYFCIMFWGLFFFRCFLMWIIFKVFTEFITILFPCYVQGFFFFLALRYLGS